MPDFDFDFLRIPSPVRVIISILAFFGVLAALWFLGGRMMNNVQTVEKWTQEG